MEMFVYKWTPLVIGEIIIGGIVFIFIGYHWLIGQISSTSMHQIEFSHIAYQLG